MPDVDPTPAAADTAVSSCMGRWQFQDDLLASCAYHAGLAQGHADDFHLVAVWQAVGIMAAVAAMVTVAGVACWLWWRKRGLLGLAREC